jgi:hypothetical protein
MGKDCRTDQEQAAIFAQVVRVVQEVRNRAESEQDANAPADTKKHAVQFWSTLHRMSKWNKGPNLSGDDALPKPGPGRDRAMVAALSQMLAPAPAPYRVGFAKFLSTISHADATNALTKLALFAPENDVRSAAIDGLKERQARDYLGALMLGLRYPLPVVSKRAAEALVKLEAKEALADLVNVLEQPDPRAPATKKVDGMQVSFVREMVRVNHHHNCLLCHAPANTDDVPTSVITAPVPLPDRALPSGGGYGRMSSPDIFVRIDMTYLRQDFSMMMKGENTENWPAQQRFDFFVRTRIVTPTEAADHEKQLSKQTPPNHAAAQMALRALTGQMPTDDSPKAWRRLIAKN